MTPGVLPQHFKVMALWPWSKMYKLTHVLIAITMPDLFRFHLPTQVALWGRVPSEQFQDKVLLSFFS